MLNLKSAAVACALIFANLSVAPKAEGAVYDLATEANVIVPTSTGLAVFSTNFLKTSGTGSYDPFLTIGSSGPTEKGYNTSSGIFDTQRAPQWNHEITVADLEATKLTHQGIDYYSFTLDINEPNGGSAANISLDALKIYLSNTPNQTTEDVDSLGTLVFDLDSIEDQTILYKDGVSGSGQADLAFFIPAAAFEGVTSNTLVYMYQEFGNYMQPGQGMSLFQIAPDYGVSGGYEETRLVPGVIIPPTVNLVPEPSAALPLVGILGLVLTSRRLWRVVG